MSFIICSMLGQLPAQISLIHENKDNLLTLRKTKEKIFSNEEDQSIKKTFNSEGKLERISTPLFEVILLE